MKIKKFTALFAASVSTLPLFSLDYFVGVSEPKSSDEMRENLSTCKFYNHGEFRTDPLSGKPGATDKIYFHWGKYYFDIDVDVNIGTLEVGDNCEVTSKKHNIKVKKDFIYHISTRDAERTLFSLDSCSMEVGGEFKMMFWDKAKSAGGGTFELINSKATFKNGLSCIIPVNTFVVTSSERSVITLDLKGKSILSFGGGAVIDAIIKESPDDWGFKFKFTEDGGAMPMVYFQQRTNFDACDIEVNFPKSIKIGKYTLIDFNDKRSSVAKAVSIVVNGEKVSYGQKIPLGGDKTAVLNIAPNIGGRDTRTSNDLVLTIK